MAKLNNAQQLAQMAAKVRKQKEGEVEGVITNIYPTLKARAEAAAGRGEVNMIISATSDPVIYQAINNTKGIQTLKDNGFGVNVTTLNGSWILDIYWDSGDPSKQVVDTTV